MNTWGKHSQLSSFIFIQLHGAKTTDADQSFFLSPSGDPEVVKKAMFKDFAKTTGLPSASTNTLRKGATTVFREDSNMRSLEPVIMDHSNRVADLNYDQGRTKLQVM